MIDDPVLYQSYVYILIGLNAVLGVVICVLMLVIYRQYKEIKIHKYNIKALILNMMQNMIDHKQIQCDFDAVLKGNQKEYNRCLAQVQSVLDKRRERSILESGKKMF